LVGLTLGDSYEIQVSVDVLVQFRAGERAAFLVVYEAFAPKVRMVAQRYFPTAFDQEEAIQEIWLMVHRQCAQFDLQKGDLGGWLWALASNRCKELWRSRVRRPDWNQPTQVEEDRSGFDTQSEPPDVQVQNKRITEAMTAFCSQLGDKDAQVFRLSCLQDHSHEEVAEQTGLSARQCKYLRMKLLSQAALDPGLQRALQEVKQA
jgi:RNA polymerase sigma factor (sigma-70 family)